MTTTRRGTALFDRLLGFPEPIPAPLPPMPVVDPYKPSDATIHEEVVFGGKLFMIDFWPTYEHNMYNVFDNQSMRARGCKFYSFSVAVDRDKGTALETMIGQHVMTTLSSGTMSTQIIGYILACAEDARQYDLDGFAESWGEDSMNDYIELRWRFCQECNNYFRRLAISPINQNMMRMSVSALREAQGLRP